MSDLNDLAHNLLTELTKIAQAGALVGKPIEPARPNGPRPNRVVVSDGSDRTNRIVFQGNPRGAVESPRLGVLVVDAGMRVASPHSGQTYHWYIKVGTASKPVKAIHEFAYEHQAFRIEAGQSANKAFHEEIPLPPGRYLVMLQLRSDEIVSDRDGNVITNFVPIASEVLTQIVR
jgi:hypothetical protein